jgi:signal transduction histidine kinase
VRLEVADGRFGADVEAAGYFLVAEALANVAKHAGADEATVAVRRENGRLLISVSDDGRGGADPLRGSGLHGLADRVAALGGSLVVESPAGAGTTLRASLPL